MPQGIGNRTMIGMPSPADSSAALRSRRLRGVGLALLAAAAAALVLAGTAGAALTQGSLGTDTSTGGDWSLTDASSASGRSYAYGTFGYVLPQSTGPTEHEVGGDRTTSP